jgi:hypothetical protein
MTANKKLERIWKEMISPSPFEILIHHSDRDLRKRNIYVYSPFVYHRVI